MSSDTDSDLDATKMILDQIIKREGRLDLLDKLQSSDDCVVVSGEYDQIEKILHALGAGYRLVPPDAVNNSVIDNVSTVFVNCAGAKLDRNGIIHLQDYVRKGGKLVTTDWAVEHVIQQAFPGTIRRLGTRCTGDEVVRIEPQGDLGQRFIGLDCNDTQPKWWLEAQSYPIEIIDNDSVLPIILSNELEQKYGSPYIAVGFRYGEGAVMHFVSHLKAQRTEVRDERDRGSLKDFATATKTQIGNYSKNVNFSGAATGFTTMHTVFSILGEKTQTLGKVPYTGSHYIIDIAAKGYSSVNFKGHERSEGIAARFDLLRSPVIIGRGSHNNVDLGNSDVSRRHAEIYLDGKECYVKDLGSSNGTYLDGKKVSMSILPDDCSLKIGPGAVHVRSFTKE